MKSGMFHSEISAFDLTKIADTNKTHPLCGSR